MKFYLVGALLLFGSQATGQPPAAKPQITARFPQEPRVEEVFGSRIAYHEFGERHRGRGPTLILIPHLQWDANAWTANAPMIGARYHVIAIDPLGHGKSDKPMLDYKMATWTDTFAEFFRKKGIKQAVYGGAGMGGALAVQMALDYPEAVQAIIVAGSSSGPGERKGGFFRGSSYGPSLDGTRNYLVDHFHDDSLITQEVVRARFGQRLEANDGYVVERHLADHRPPYSKSELSRIKVPALFPWCREDAVTPLKWGEAFASALPQGRLAVIESCGHFPNMEKPHQFNSAVMDFLAGLSRP